MLHVRVGLVLVASCTLLGCGDDDSSSSGNKAGTGGGGGKGGSGVMLRDGGAATGGGTGGSGAVGTAEEGDECTTANPCTAELTCLGADLPDGMGGTTAIKVCARACTDATADCNDGEVCGGFTNDPKDRMCIKLVDKQFEECGPGVTSGCDRTKDLGCAYLGDDPDTLERELRSICVKLCQTEPSAADAGPPTGTEAGCDQDQVCQEDPPGSGGICATPVARGGTCDPIGTLFCEAEEIDRCVPDDLDNIDASTWHCRQDCSETDATCDTGACMTITDGTNTLGWCI